MLPRTLELIGRLADGWVPSLGREPLATYRSAARQIDEAAIAAGRDPSEIRRIFNVSGQITDGASGTGPLDGPVDQWIETLGAWTEDLGADAFIVWPPDTSVLFVERLAAEIAPAVRERDAKDR